MASYSQAGQDKFILAVIKDKYNQYFLEIGSNDPVRINNTYLLESEYGWKGLMVEYNSDFEQSYIKRRPNSIYAMCDATRVNYRDIFVRNGFPHNMGYLQIDLEVTNRSTLSTLELLDSTLFGEYRFAVVTFEHDIYRGDFFDTRNASRAIFEKHGYVRIFQDVKYRGYTFEDWYVYPDLVNMEAVRSAMHGNSLEYTDNLSMLLK